MPHVAEHMMLVHREHSSTEMTMDESNVVINKLNDNESQETRSDDARKNPICMLF